MTVWGCYSPNTWIVMSSACKVEGFGLLIAALVVVETRQVVEAVCHIRMALAEELFILCRAWL